MRAVISLRGQILVAAPLLTDPNFHRTVILVGEHGAEGAMGVVLNRPSPVAVSEALAPLSRIVDDGDVVYVGGPVQTDAVIVLADFVEPGRSAGVVFDSVGFVPGEVEDSADLGPLRRARVFVGYSGWGPGQLENELDEQAWILAEATTDDVFAQDAERLWTRVLRRLGGAYAVLALMPDDPRVN
jgi:putative transcriptional regulator